MLPHTRAETFNPRVHSFSTSVNYPCRKDFLLCDDGESTPSPLAPQGIGSQFVYRVSFHPSDSQDVPNPPGMYESLQKDPYSSSLKGYTASTPDPFYFHGIIEPQKSFGRPAIDTYNVTPQCDPSFVGSYRSGSLPSTDSEPPSSPSYLIASHAQNSTSMNDHGSVDADSIHSLKFSLRDRFLREHEARPERSSYQRHTLLDHPCKPEPVSEPFVSSNGTPPSRSLADQFIYGSTNAVRSPSHQADYGTALQWKQEGQTARLDSFGTGDQFDTQSLPLVPPGLDYCSGSQYLLQIPHFLNIEDHRYGWPPTGTSTSTSSAPGGREGATHNGVTPARVSSPGKDVHFVDSNSKTYAFVALPGNPVKKRTRRRYDEIERLYQCSWQGCTKGYGTLNHLNAHVAMQNHGPKRSPDEFKDLRKKWRKAKKKEQDSRSNTRWSGQCSVTDPGYNPYDGRYHTDQHPRHPVPDQLGLHRSQPAQSLNARDTEAAAFPIADSHRPNEEGLSFRSQKRELMRRTPFTPGSTQSSVTPTHSLPTYCASNGLNNTRSYDTVSNKLPSAPDTPLGRLPRDGTLLIPTSYDSSSLLPPLQVDVGLGDHEGDHPYGLI